MRTLRYLGWGALAGVTDMVPHLAYGAVTVATLHALDRRPPVDSV